MSEVVASNDGTRLPSTPIRDIGKAKVELARVWPAAGSWGGFSAYIDATGAEEAWAPGLGSAELRQVFGILRQPDKAGLLSYGIVPNLGHGGSDSLLGRYVRISRAETTDDDAVFTPCWWGTIIEADRDTDGHDGVDTGGEAVWRCAGLGYLLEKMRPIRGHEINAAGTVSDPGEVLVFNQVAGGDRSASKANIGRYSRLAYVHDRAGGAGEWTALDVVEYLLYGHADATESDIRWEVGGQTTALNFAEVWDLRGLTLWQALVRVINARHGVSFRITVDSGTGRPTLFVNSTAPTAFTIGSTTTPANNVASSITFAGDRWKDGVSLTEKEGTDYDEVIVAGPRQLWTTTLTYKQDGTGDLVKGWDTALESTWTSTTKDTKYEHVWRRFKLRTDWNWTPRVGSTLVLNGRRTQTDSVYGEEGFIGGLITLIPTPPAWSTHTVRFERLTALLEGYDYKAIQVSDGSTMATTSVDWSVSRLPPLVFISSSSGSTWADISTDYTVRTETDTAAIVLGNGITEAAKIKASINISGAWLAFTVSFRHPFQSLVSYRRPRGERTARDFPRRVILPAPHGEYWYLMRDTMVGITGTTPKQMISPLTLVTHIPQMTQILGAAKAWYTTPERELSWTEVGQVDITAARAPGSMVTTADLGDRTATINGIITRRAWDFTEAGWGTSYRVERLKPDLEAVL